MIPGPEPESHPPIMSPSLRPGDKIRFVSPASAPDQEAVLRGAEELESWGLRVDFGAHAFRKTGYLAGTDAERLADLNDALRDPEVRAIFATRGGKGSYRIADQLDFAAARGDPKFLVGYSDITALHLSLLKHCGVVGIHGALGSGSPSLKAALMTADRMTVRARAEEDTFALTTHGTAHGILMGGNLDMVATSAGWNLPPLCGGILLLEAVNMFVGQVDRQLTMLRKGGHLSGLSGIAIGRFTGFGASDGVTIIDLLREHLAGLGVPILGGLPLGHGDRPGSILVGAMAVMDTVLGELTVLR